MGHTKNAKKAGTQWGLQLSQPLQGLTPAIHEAAAAAKTET